MSTDRTPAEIEVAVFAYLRDEAKIDVPELDRDTKLVRTGLLDSVSLVQLATWVERTFGIEVPDENIDGDHLESIGMIVEYVLARLEVP
jgi:acyl carrier protein